jgi:hypothetical protein
VIEITPLSLILLALASAVTGAFLYDQMLRVFAKFGARVAYEPSCVGCGKTSGCFITETADCLDCLVEASEDRLAESDALIETLTEELRRNGAALKKLDEAIAESQAKMKKIDALLGISDEG